MTNVHAVLETETGLYVFADPALKQVMASSGSLGGALTGYLVFRCFLLPMLA